MKTLLEKEIRDDSLRSDIYELVSQYVSYGEWRTPSQFDHLFERLRGLLPRPQSPMTLYRVLRLTDDQRSEYEAGTLVLRNRKFSSWTHSLDAARRLAQIKGNNCIIINHQFPADNIVVDVAEFYQDNDLDNYDFPEYYRYVLPEQEVIVFDSGEMQIDHYNSYLFQNENATVFPQEGDRAFEHADDENGFRIEGVQDDQPFATRGLYRVSGNFGEYWVRSIGPREWELVDEITENLTEEVGGTVFDNPERNAGFEALAQGQRGDPEIAMLRVQHAMGGGVLSYVVEHVGDLTHRAAQYPEKIDYYCGYELVLPKVERSLRMLESGYGFEREMNENIRNNARYREVSEDDLRARIRKALRVYADEHARLRVYNKAQWLAREAAVSLGREQFNRARQCLHALMDHLGSREEWAEFASPYDPEFNQSSS